MRAALAVNAANTLHGYLDITNRTNFQIGAPSIFLEGLLRSVIFSHTWDIEICLVNRLMFAFVGTSWNWVGSPKGNDLILDITDAEHRGRIIATSL
jgi:hypothetical protein